MKGSIVNRNGNYSIVLNLEHDPETGKRKQQWIAVKGNKKEAERQLNEMVNQFNHGSFVKPTKLTVRDHFTQWLDSYAVPNLSPATVESYRFIATKHIYPRLGNITLTALRPQAVQALYSDMVKSGLTNATIRKIHNCLHVCLENAIKTGLLANNPLNMVQCPKIIRREMKTMSVTDIHLVLDRARESEYYPLWYTYLFSAARRGELLGLKWGDLDLLLLKISINKSLSYLNTPTKDGNRLRLKPPKTNKSRRYISITPSNAIVLREHHQKQNETRQSLGLPLLTDDDFVFCHFDGKPYLPNTITHTWIKLVRRCGLPGIRLHDCRHTYATQLMSQNVHPSIVANQLGHASVRTTLDSYSHVSPAMQATAAMKFDDIVMGAENIVR
jgi:integrase